VSAPVGLLRSFAQFPPTFTCTSVPGITIRHSKEEKEVARFDGNAPYPANGGRTLEGHHTFQQPSAHQGPQLPVSANKPYPLNPSKSSGAVRELQTEG